MQELARTPRRASWLALRTWACQVAPRQGRPAYLETFLAAAIDAALAAQNAVTAAEIAGTEHRLFGAMRNNPLQIAEVLGLPSGTMGVFGLCVGYALAGIANEVKPRLPQSVILHHNSYGAPDKSTARDAYDAQMAAFSQRNEMTRDTWTKRVLGRMGKIASLSGRDRLVATLHMLGFELK